MFQIKYGELPETITDIPPSILPESYHYLEPYVASHPVSQASASISKFKFISF